MATPARVARGAGLASGRDPVTVSVWHQNWVSPAAETRSRGMLTELQERLPRVRVDWQVVAWTGPLHTHVTAACEGTESVNEALDKAQAEVTAAVAKYRPRKPGSQEARKPGSQVAR